MLDDNIPEEVTEERIKEIYRDRFPSYCHQCGEEVVVAGGQLTPVNGWYEHLDPVLMCERGCWKDRFTAGVDQQEGQEWRVAPGADLWSDTALADVAGYCDIHREQMVPTKDLLVGAIGRVRQWKCPECDREFTATTVDG